jgi:hypothetical protein
LKLILFEKQDVLNLRWTGTKTNRFRENVWPRRHVNGRGFLLLTNIDTNNPPRGPLHLRVTNVRQARVFIYFEIELGVMIITILCSCTVNGNRQYF